MLLNFSYLGVTRRHIASTPDRRSEFELPSGVQPEVLRPASTGRHYHTTFPALVLGVAIKTAAPSFSAGKMPYRSQSIRRWKL
jgi:hypothetical protein